MFRGLLITGILILTTADATFAHCDSVNGPVVTTARAALEKGDVTPVLKWVKPSNEAEIRAAFATAMKVRALSPEARQLADNYFFETLVRIHRQGEGEPYTGLQPATYKVEEGIVQADLAIEKGSLDSAEALLTGSIRSGLHARFNEVVEARKHADESVDAGRRYVAAYVGFIHYVERLHIAASAGRGEEGTRDEH
jgi:Family of unknown function (DUF6448)